MYSKLPSCFFPTTTILVDDNKNFITSLSHELNSNNLTNIFFNNAEDAYKAITDHHNAFNFISEVLIHPFNNNSQKSTIDIDIRGIHKIVYNPNRFREISILIVDYAMPGTNGLELCTKLKDYPILKILLTGEADEKIAVAAFNERIIDRYIRKDTKDFLSVIEQSIKELQLLYFHNTTKIIQESLINNPDTPNHNLSDPAFDDLFNDIIIKNKICEYYLLESSGSFLLVDIYGTPSWLVVKENDDIKSYLEIADQGGAPQSVIDSLKYKKMLPFFFTDTDFNIPPSHWEAHMHPASYIKGNHEYYYSYIKNKPFNTLVLPKIRSFQQFLNSTMKS